MNSIFLPDTKNTYAVFDFGKDGGIVERPVLFWDIVHPGEPTDEIPVTAFCVEPTERMKHVCHVEEYREFVGFKYKDDIENALIGIDDQIAKEIGSHLPDPSEIIFAIAKGCEEGINARKKI